MHVRAKWSLLLLGLWFLCGVSGSSLRRTMADIQDALLSPSSQRYSVYVLPPATHAENLRKRQADYEDYSAKDDVKVHLEGSRDASLTTGDRTPSVGFLEVAHDPSHFVGPVREGEPLFLSNFDPELQPGWGHEEELEDKMDSYAVDPTPGSSSLTINGEGPGGSQDAPTPSDAEKDTKILKKLLDKPKKLMKVIKVKGNGNYVPEEVPGVMIPTEDGVEEAFVPENLLEDAELLLTAGSAQQPTYVSPDALPTATPAPMGGMPYEFGWVVDDEATANFQTRQEKGDKNGVVTGCYQVLDPNGLVRTVTYRADKGGFRVLSLTRGPDKTPCPGLEDGNRIQIPTSSNPRLRPSYPANNGGFSNNFANNFSKATSSSSNFQSSSSSNYSSSSQQSSSFNAFGANNLNVNNVYEQPPVSTYAPPTSPRPTYAPPPPPPSPAAAPPDYYNLQGSAQQAWMAEYLQNITKQLYSSYTNSSTLTNNIYGSGGSSGFVNFPFVLIPITTFLDLKKSGAISGDVQSYGAFVQPSTGQLQLSQYLQQLEQQRQQQQQQQQQQERAYNRTVQHTTTNTYNTTETDTKQLKHKVQGVDTINYQISGERGRPGSQRVQQQVQRHQQSSQAEKNSHRASSSSSNSFQSSLGASQGYLPPTNQQPIQQQYQQRQQSSQSSKSSSSSEKSSSSAFQSSLGGIQGYLPPNKQGGQRQYQNYQQQSAQSAKSHNSSSSSSSNSFQSNFGGFQGPSPSQQAAQQSIQQSSQSSKKSSSSSSSSSNSSFQSNYGSLQGYLPPSNGAKPDTGYGFPSTSSPYQPRPTTSVPSTARPYQPRPTTPRPTTARPYRPAPTTPRPYRPAPTTPRPYQPAPTTPRPYQPAPTTPRPYQPAPTTPRPYQPAPTTPRPYRPAPTTPRPYQPAPTTPRPYRPAPTTPRPYQPAPTTARPIPSSPRPSQSYDLPSFGSGSSASYSSQKSQSSQESQNSQSSQSSSSSSNYGNGLASQNFQSQASSSKKADSSKKSQSSSNFAYNSGNNGGIAQQSSSSSLSSSSSSASSSSSSFKQNSFGGFNSAGSNGGSGLSGFPGFASSPSPPSYVPPSAPATVGPQYGAPSPDIPDYDEPEPSYIDPSDSGFSVPAAEPQFDMDGWVPISSDYSPPSDPQAFTSPTPEPSPSLAFPAAARGGNKNFSYSSSQSSNSENKSSSQQSQQFSSSWIGAGPQQGFTQQQNQQLPDWVAQQYGG